MLISGSDWNDLRLYSPTDYVVFKEDTNYFAMGKYSGSTDYSGTVFSAVINAAIKNLVSGSIYVMAGNYTLTDTIYITGSTAGSDSSVIALIFSAGTNINFTGTTTAIQMGSTTTEMKRCNIYGNGARLYRSSGTGGTGSHLMNSHLSTIDHMRIDNFDVCLLLEGSWATQVKRCELNGNGPTGSYGMRMINTRAGTYLNSQCNLMNCEDSWFKGTVAGADVLANGGYTHQHEDLHFLRCDFNNSPIGLNLGSAYGAVIEKCYFEDDTGYDIKMGTDPDVQVTEVYVLNNLFGIIPHATGSYVGNVDTVIFGGNIVTGQTGSDLQTGSIFIWASGSSNQRIHIPFPNRVDTAIEYTGSVAAGTGSLMYHMTQLNINKAIFLNNKYLEFRDSAGIARDILEYSWDNKVVIKNPLTGSTSNSSIEIGTETSGGEIHFYDWGASRTMGYFHNQWFQPPYNSSDPNTGSWASAEAGRMWYNTTAKNYRYYDGNNIIPILTGAKV